MSVKVRPYRRGGWEVDIAFRLPDGRIYRERKRAPTPSRSGALRWATDRERHLLQHGPAKKKEVPTLGEFAKRVIENARADGRKPSGIVAKESIFRNHLEPSLGNLKLDQITTEKIQALKAALGGRAPKTINNILVTLSGALRTAVDWDILERMPCKIRLLSVPKESAGFHDFGEFERMVEAAKPEAEAYLITLLASEAGLRCGEMLALQWSDVDLSNSTLSVQRSNWRGYVTSPKGGRGRVVPLTVRLTAALREHRHLKGPLVLCKSDGQPLTHRIVASAVRRIAKKASVSRYGVHRLRHTFCSHLAMRGAPAKAIQELAGHQDLKTTQRYTHLSPAAIESAIRLLDQRGDIAETATGESSKAI